LAQSFPAHALIAKDCAGLQLRLQQGGLRMKPLRDCRLYTFVDCAYLRGRDPKMVTQQLCDGGSDLIQLRAKDRTPDEIRRMAEAILPLTQRAGVGLVINDFLSVASETGALYCHLGQEDFFDAGHTHVSQLKDAGSSVQIGLSSHEPEQARRAVAGDCTQRLAADELGVLRGETQDEIPKVVVACKSPR